jgi:SP family xylose:H+ symportor-like MFS transporter
MSYRPVTWLALVATFGGLLFGYDTAVISGAVGAIDANFIAPRQLAEISRNSLSGITVSSALFGCILGAALSGWIADRFGRKAGLFVAGGAFLVSSVGSALPELGIAPIGSLGPAALLPFNFYRVIGGAGVGLASMLSPLYIAEIAPKSQRGRLVSYNQLAIVLGITAIYFVNWVIARHADTAWLNSSGWRWMFASEALPALAFLCLLPTVPDTPRWLAMQGRTDEAYALLVTLGGEAEARQSIEEIRASLVVRHERLFAFGARALVIGVMVPLFQQGVGINAVTYYAPAMFENMGASSGGAFLQTILVGVALTAATLVAIKSVDRVGRRPLLVVGGLVMALAMMALGYEFQRGQPGLGALVMVMIYIAAFGMSWGPVTWVLLAELFPNSIKGRALAIATAVDWVANLGVSWSFRILDGSTYLNARFHHGFAYYLYGGVSLLAAVFVVQFVPETMGKSLEAIQSIWRPVEAAGGGRPGDSGFRPRGRKGSRRSGPIGHR